MKTNIFYRPPCTCGKYNSEKNVAIVFNLLSKMNYLYENESAEVINCILSVGRYGKVSVKEVSVKCNIDEESIYNFFNDLCSTGLLADSEITDEIVADYRNVCKNTSQNTTTIGTRAEELTRNGTTSAYHAFANAVNRMPLIVDAMFELTYRCQAQCVHCYNPGATRNDKELSGRADTEELSLEDYKRIIDDFCNNGLTHVTLTEGDPFMHPYIWQIIDYLYQKEIATSIYTNGLGLVGKEEKLATYYPYTVQCSLYSGDSKVHDKITRKQGSWQRTVSIMD